MFLSVIDGGSFRTVMSIGVYDMCISKDHKFVIGALKLHVRCRRIRCQRPLLFDLERLYTHACSYSRDLEQF